ncbi:hypothetical protein SEVIR_5G171300v4 [Setaria viridis]|uniref:Uncharacterized protein n=1 Tax=Setaria viridis TaxID=4556 RepID=A0A4U6UTR7_SETVI|nr:hypothetical protein SEVIR_5G171300v2 [Setaria viridis]
MGHDLHPYGHFSCHRRLGAAPVLRIDVAPPLAFPLASPPHRLASTPAAPALGFRWHNRRRAGRRNSPPALGSPRQTMPPIIIARNHKVAMHPPLLIMAVSLSLTPAMLSTAALEYSC